MQLVNGDWKATVKKFKKLLNNPENREKIFSHYGGAFVYLTENPHVTLHHTENPEILTEMDAHGTSEFPSELIEKREDYATQQVQNFLRKNPGKKVVMIF